MQKFELGRTVVTQGALEALLRASTNPLEMLGRHVPLDRGSLDAEDHALNQLALKTGGRIFSAFVYTAGIKFYVITEWDRSSTCILLPSEY